MHTKGAKRRCVVKVSVEHKPLMIEDIKDIRARQYERELCEAAIKSRYYEEQYIKRKLLKRKLIHYLDWVKSWKDLNSFPIIDFVKKIRSAYDVRKVICKCQSVEAVRCIMCRLFCSCILNPWIENLQICTFCQIKEFDLNQEV